MLEKILPRALGSSDSDCASILTSLIMAAHFERTNARSLGWRGVLASASEHPAWTCRVADAPQVFGLRFEGEEKDDAVSCLRGYFSMFIFPKEDDLLLDLFPLSAMKRPSDHLLGMKIFFLRSGLVSCAWMPCLTDQHLR